MRGIKMKKPLRERGVSLGAPWSITGEIQIESERIREGTPTEFYIGWKLENLGVSLPSRDDCSLSAIKKTLGHKKGLRETPRPFLIHLLF